MVIFFSSRLPFGLALLLPKREGLPCVLLFLREYLPAGGTVQGIARAAVENRLPIGIAAEALKHDDRSFNKPKRGSRQELGNLLMDASHQWSNRARVLGER